MEWRRIITRKKSIWFVIILFALSLGLYTGDQLSIDSLDSVLDKKELHLQYLSVYQNMDINEVLIDTATKWAEKRVFSDLLYYEEMKSSYPESYEEYGRKDEETLRMSYPEISRMFDERKSSLIQSRQSLEADVLYEFQQQAQYLYSYPNFLKEINEHAKQMTQVSIFNQNNSFVQQNINKTVQDYAKLQGLKLSLGVDKAITTVIQYSAVHFILLFFIIGFVFQIISERSLGLWSLIYSTPYGRTRLAIRRSCIILLGITIMTVITYGALFILGFSLYGGQGSLNRPVQSIAIFRDITTPVSIGEFLMIYVGVKILFGFLLAMIIWFFLSIINNKLFSIGILGFFLAVEYSGYRWLPAQSNLNAFKYINLFYYINPTEIIIKYHNLSIFGRCIARSSAIFVVFLVTLTMFVTGCSIISSKRKPIHSLHRIDLFLDKMMDFFHKATETLSVFGIELYKLLVLKKGILVLFGLFWLQYQNLETGELYYDGTGTFMNTFYQQMSGIPDSDVTDYLAELNDTLSNVDSEFQKATASYQNSSISNKEYNLAVMKYSVYDSQRKAVLLIQNQLTYLEQLKSEKGIESWLVNPRGYEYLLGNTSFSYHRQLAAEAIFALILLLFSIFSSEKQTGAVPIIRATNRGRDYLYRRKILTSAVMTIAVWMILYGLELYNAGQFMGITCLQAPIQSLPFLKEFPFPISIVAFLIFLYLLRLSLLLSIAFLLCYISLRTTENSLLLSAILLLVPSLLFMIGIDVFSYIAFTVPIGFMEIILGTHSYWWFILLVLILVGGAVSIPLSKNEWCHTNKSKGIG